RREEPGMAGLFRVWCRLFPCARGSATIQRRTREAIMRRTALSLLIAIPLGLAAAHANAAELKVLGAGPVDGTFRQLVPAFTRATGHKVEGTFDTVGVIQNKLKSGEKPDVLILTAAAMDELAKAGALVAASSIEVGRGTSGLA